MKVFLLALGFAVLIAANPTRAIGAPERPNLIFLLTDDQRSDAVGCMGNPVVQTPNMDRLAAGGVLFENNFCTTSICAVSRASLLTGQYARRHGIHDFATALSPEAFSETYPALLREAGYRTGFVGKWGVGGALPKDQFDFFAGFEGQGRYFENDDPSAEHLTRRLGQSALEFLRGASAGQPFCLSVSFKAPHVQDGHEPPFVFDRAYGDLYEETTIEKAGAATATDFEAQPEFIRNSEGRKRWQRRFATEELYQQSVKGYYRLISGVDRVVGEITAELERLGFARRTAIVLTSDNGFFLGEHGLAGKWLMHEESIRTPLIVYLPWLPESARGTRRTEMALSIDVAPTLLDLAHVGIPEKMQGRSLRGLIEGGGGPWRKHFFYEHLFDYGGRIPATEGVRGDRWKYVRYLGTEPPYEELFDLESDPLEQRNLAARPAARTEARLEQMRELAVRFARELR